MDRNINTRFVYDGSHLAIKNITLGYSLPIKNSRHINSMRMYASVQQAYVFTSYMGNPEVSSVSGGAAVHTLAGEGAARVPPNAANLGQDWMTYPVPRTFTIGLNIGL